MDIITFAIQMEKDGQAFYEKAASAASTTEIKEIFQYLADEEKRHCAFFKKMADGEITTAIEALKGGSLKTTKNVFVQLIEENKAASFGDDVRATWVEALKFEERAVQLYTEEAEKEPDADRKTLLNRIADEERNHVYLIDNILTFMADPQTFVDSKQYGDFQSWEGH